MFLLFSNKVSGSTQLAKVGLHLLPESSASTSQVLDYKLGPPYPVISLYDTADTLTEETQNGKRLVGGMGKQRQVGIQASQS